MASKDYYKILGVEKSASKDEVKKAFRKLASTYHPDKKTGDESKFKEISEAYAVLSDDKKRAEYDAYGQSFSGGSGGGFSGFNGGFGNGVEFDLNDIFQGFGDMFGGFGGRTRSRGRDISIDIELSFRNAIFGLQRTVLLTKNNTCTECNGSGAKHGTETITCSTCNGNGRVRETRQSIMGSFTTVRECSACNGTGKIPKESCASCRGSGVNRAQSEVKINVPAGVEHGEVIRMTGQGEAISRGEPGDLYIKLHVASHPTITRDGTTLLRVLPIKFTDALLGGIYTVETLDGTVELKIPAGIRHGEMLRIKERGVPHGHGGKRGDFMVKIAIEIPTKLSRKARSLIEDLRTEGI